MSKSPINEAILSQVLNHMRNGQLRRCIEMGLEPEILAQLQQPAVLSLLLNTPVSWCHVTIDTEMVKKLLTGAERSPSPFEIAWVLGKEESLKRLENSIKRLS